MTNKTKKILKKAGWGIVAACGLVFLGFTLQQIGSGNSFGFKFGKKIREMETEQNQLLEKNDYEGVNAQLKSDEIAKLITQWNNKEISDGQFKIEISKVKDYYFTVPEFLEKYVSAQDNERYSALTEEIGSAQNKNSAICISAIFAGAAVASIGITGVIFGYPSLKRKGVDKKEKTEKAL